MRFRTLEIRWHDSKPISTCDFQPVSFKKARPGPGQEKNYAGQSYRLATGGEDNHVRVSTIKGLYAGSRLTTRRLSRYGWFTLISDPRVLSNPTPRLTQRGPRELST
jgi:hypothetical protein